MYSCCPMLAAGLRRHKEALGGRDVKMHTCLGTWLLSIALQGRDGPRSYGEVPAQSSDDQKVHHWG